MEAKRESKHWEKEVYIYKTTIEDNRPTSLDRMTTDPRDKGHSFFLASQGIRLEYSKYKMQKAQEREKKAEESLSSAKREYDSCLERALKIQ